MSVKKKRAPDLPSPAYPLPDGVELTLAAQEDWTRLTRLLPLNSGPRFLFVLVDSPTLRRHLAEHLAAALQVEGHVVARLDFTTPYYQPLQEIFDAVAKYPNARFCFLFGLERSLVSLEHRVSAFTDLNLHRDQISQRLTCPLVIWTTDEAFTDLANNAPDFIAWRSGVFTLVDPSSVLEAPYRQHIIDRFGKLTLYSATSDAPLAVDLERVFVKLTVELRWQVGKRGFSSEGIPLDMPSSRLLSVPRWASGEFSTTASVSEVLRDSQCLALIGAPGAGKTTLLKYLALTFARRQARVRLELDEERLPIFITLRDFSRFLDHAAQRDSRSYTSPLLLPRFLNDHIKAIAPHLNLPDDFFSRQLEAGKCIVLLDGLDEITDPSKRGRVIEVIASFTPHYRGNRFILTSRPRGYEGEAKQRLSSFCAECTIRDFDEEDMAAFARSWYTAVTIDRLGDNPTARDTALTRADDLLYAVRADERVKALAHNPLLLSVLAMVHQRGVGLPQRRAELYDECTDMLLGYWDQTKGGEAARELANAGALTRAEKRTLLEPIALWFHERGEQGLEASKEKLEKEIAHQFQEIFSDDETKARSRAVLFLRVIDERAGLLVERETGVYAFAHLTFQEYLAACAIADRDDYIAYTLRHLHDPWWREVILLEVGHLSDMRHFGRRARKLTSDLIRAIRNTGSWLEDVLKQDFLFAARCLCDAGPLGVDDELRQALIDELLTLWRTTLYHPQWQEVTSIFAFAIPTVDGPRIRAELLGCLNKTDKLLRIRSLATLRRIGAAVATEEIVARMLALTADENVDVRREAVRVLGRMANMVAMRETMERLLVLISRGDWEVTSVVAEALRTLGGAVAPDIVARLFSFTTDEDPHVRNAAIQALGAVGKVSPGEVEIVERLVTLIANADAHWSMEYAVVQTFEALGAAAAKPEVVARLLTLATDTHAVVRVNAIRALEGIGKAAARPEVVVRLLALTADEDARVRQVATAALGAMGKGIATPQVVTRLLELTDDPSVRREALIALGAIDEATPEVVAQLLKIIGGTDTQQIAAAVLGQLGDTVATKEVITRLLTLVADKTLDVRLATLRALGEIGEAAATKEVVTQLLELLTNTDARIDVRYEAAWALGQMSKVATSTELVDSLARFWQDHLNDDRRYGIGRVYGPVCEAAYEELQRLAARQERKPQP